MLPLAGDWGLQQELEAAAGCQAQQPHLEGQDVAIHLKFLQRQSTCHPHWNINSVLIGENSTWRQSQPTHLRLASFSSAKETQAGEAPFPLTTVPSRMRWCCRWPSGNELLMEKPLLPAPATHLSCQCHHEQCVLTLCSPCRKVPDGGREDWRMLLVLPEVLKSTGTTPSRDSSLLRAGPCTTMKWFSCQ